MNNGKPDEYNAERAVDNSPPLWKRRGKLFDVSGTPFESLKSCAFETGIPLNHTFGHTMIIGGSGHGKTTLLETLFLKSLEAGASIVVIDSQQQLIGKILRLAAVHKRRLTLIDPKDSPALNVFAPSSRTYAHDTREQLRNQTLEIMAYCMDSLVGADLTTRQSVLFTNLVTLLLTFPETMGRNATLFDLFALTEDITPYRDAIKALNPFTQNFFLGDFSAKRSPYERTKEEIRYRLRAILDNPSLARLFVAPENTIDFYEELKDGILLVNTDKNFLGAKNSSYLGRIAITLILQAIIERGANPGPHRPTHVYIDEVGEYFDHSIDTFLTEARKHNCGIFLAFQDLGKINSPELRSSIFSNTSTKFVGGPSTQDARTLSAELRIPPEYILDQQKLQFACSARGLTHSPASFSVNFGQIEKQPQVTEAEYLTFRERNRKRLAATAPAPMPTIAPVFHAPTSYTQSSVTVTVSSPTPSLKVRVKNTDEDLNY